MMTLATTTPDGEPQAFGLPLLTRLLPGLVRVIALAVAAHDRLCLRERRAAPLGARDRVRAGLLGDVWRMGALAAIRAWGRRDLNKEG
jgi:hypothetical protein